jgi:DNA-binding transcriptional MerR regulator
MAEGNEKLYTLTEVAEKTGISMPTLQRYKKNYQARIPSKGKGRKQRYPEEALPVFEELKKENVKRRGRPKKSEGKAKRGPGRKKKAAAADKSALLTLTKISEETGISYPTLVRYVKLHKDRLPYEGSGRGRRFHPEAIEIFKQLRAESPRGRRRKGAVAPKPKAARRAAAPAGGGGGDLAQRVGSLEKSQEGLEKQIKELIKLVKRPLKVTINRQ